MERSALKSRRFATYVMANFVSQVGTWVQRVAIGWLSWDISHSATSVGLISALLFAPTILTGAVFGALADRSEARAASILANVALMAVALLFCFVEAAGAMSLPVLALLSLVQGTASAAYQPIRLSIIADIVAPSQLANAVALNSVAFNLSRLVGPTVSGVLIASAGAFAAFAVNAVSIVPLLVVVMFLRRSAAPARSSGKNTNLIGEIREAGRYLLGNERLARQLLVTTIASALGRGPLELLPALAAQHFVNSAMGLAWSTSVLGAGALAASVSLAAFHLTSDRRASWALAAAALLGVATMGVGLARDPAIVLAGVFIMGLSATFTAVASQTLLQSETLPALRGRVASIWVTLSLGSPAAAGLVLGVASDAFGLAGSIVCSGVLCLSLSLVLAVQHFRKA